MRKGFIFEQSKCVACSACGAACILENKWEVSPRMVYTYNIDAVSSLPLINLSLACNHCEKPVCLDGCPSDSYFRDKITGAVVLNDKKCIGCKYCKWNCPYDAPKFNSGTKVIGKCNLCYTGLNEGRMPACTSACPTGALSFGEITNKETDNIPLWFPDKNLNPAIKFTGKLNTQPLRIVSDKKFDSENIIQRQENRLKSSLLSLIAFTFLSTISVALIISSGINGVLPNIKFYFSIIALAGISSLFHLGKVSRAWRAVLNIKSSPLSIEIALFIIYSVLSVSGIYLELPLMIIISSITGLLFLLSIDNVYNYAEKGKYSYPHSGQTFLSSLLIISFLSETLIPFIFIAILKSGLSVYWLLKVKTSDSYSHLRTIRLAILVISTASLIYYNSLNTMVIIIFIAGELLDRIIFYIDFDQLNIKTLIISQSTTSKK